MKLESRTRERVDEFPMNGPHPGQEAFGAGPSAPLISLRNIFFAYRSQVVLADVSVDVSAGEFVSIIGPSGCGKSTLLLLLDAAAKPDAGEVLINGKPVVRGGRDRAMVFQDFALFPWMTVEENVVFALDFQRKDLSGKERLALAHRYIAAVGLSSARTQYPHQISGGMKQRAGLARAFAVESQILLMDEPFGALDAQNAEILREDLLRLVAEEQRTVLFVTHNLDEALQLSHRILLMTAAPGQIKQDVTLNLPDRDDPDREQAVVELRAMIWEHLKVEVQKVQKRERGVE